MLEIRRGTKEDIAQVAAIYDHILTEEEDGCRKDCGSSEDQPGSGVGVC